MLLNRSLHLTKQAPLLELDHYHILRLCMACWWTKISRNMWTKYLSKHGQIRIEKFDRTDDTPSDGPWTSSDDPESPYVIG